MANDEKDFTKMYPTLAYIDTDIDIDIAKRQTNSTYGMMGGFTKTPKIVKIKHLQIGDVFYVIDDFKVHCQKVRAIAVEPDDAIIYNWKYRQERVYTNLNDVINVLQEQSDALIEKVKDELRGNE